MKRLVIVVLAMMLSIAVFLAFRYRDVHKVGMIPIHDVTEVRVWMLPPASDIEYTFKESADITRHIEKINSYEYIPIEKPKEGPKGGLQYRISGKRYHNIIFYGENYDSMALYDGKWYRVNSIKQLGFGLISIGVYIHFE